MTLAVYLKISVGQVVYALKSVFDIAVSLNQEGSSLLIAEHSMQENPYNLLQVCFYQNKELDVYDRKA